MNSKLYDKVPVTCFFLKNTLKVEMKKKNLKANTANTAVEN